MIITGKVFLQSSTSDLTDQHLNVNLDVNQFYEAFPEELRAHSERESSIIIRLNWRNQIEDISTQKGGRLNIQYGYRTVCRISFLDPSTKKNKFNWLDGKDIFGDWQPKLAGLVQLPPAWPKKAVFEYLRESVSKKICINCEKEIFLERWSCPHCGHTFTDGEMLLAENEIRNKRIHKKLKADKGMTIGWSIVLILFLVSIYGFGGIVLYAMRNNPTFVEEGKGGGLGLIIFLAAMIVIITLVAIRFWLSSFRKHKKIKNYKRV